MTRADIRKLARQAGATTTYTNRHYPDMPFHTFSPDQLERFHALVIADFLARGGQYVTNDASREAAIAEAVAVEQEACDASSDRAYLNGLRAGYTLGHLGDEDGFRKSESSYATAIRAVEAAHDITGATE